MQEEYKTNRYKELEEGLAKADGVYELIQTEAGKNIVESLRKQLIYHLDVITHYASSADAPNTLQAVSRFQAVLDLYRVLTKSVSEKESFEKALKDEYEKIQSRL